MIEKAINEYLTKTLFERCVHVLEKSPNYTTLKPVYRCSICGQDGFDFITDYEGRVVGLINFFTSEGFFKLWKKLREQEWYETEFRRNVYMNDWNLVDPAKFAVSVYEFLEGRKNDGSTN